MLSARLANSLEDDQMSVSVCALSNIGELDDILESQGITNYCLNKKDGKDLSIPSKLATLIRQKNIDIVHTHGQGPLMYSCLAKFFYRNFLLVHTEHINFEIEDPNPRKIYLYNTIFFRMIDRFISISEHLTNYYQKRFPFLKTITTITNGINVEQFSNMPDKTTIIEELNVSPESLIVGNIAVMREQKDQETLIRAMVPVTQKIPNAILIIAGTGPLEDYLKALVDNLGLKKVVYFLGYRNDVLNLLASFDLFVLSSLFEGLPLSLLEAAAAGVPIITTDVVGNNELIHHQVNGLLSRPKSVADLAEKIVELLLDREKAAKLSKMGIQIIHDKYDEKMMVKKYKKAYRSLLKEPK